MLSTLSSLQSMNNAIWIHTTANFKKQNSYQKKNSTIKGQNGNRTEELYHHIAQKLHFDVFSTENLFVSMASIAKKTYFKREVLNRDCNCKTYNVIRISTTFFSFSFHVAIELFLVPLKTPHPFGNRLDIDQKSMKCLQLSRVFHKLQKSSNACNVFRGVLNSTGFSF